MGATELCPGLRIAWVAQQNPEYVKERSFGDEPLIVR